MYNAYAVYNPMQTLRIMHACIFHEIYYVLLTTVDLLAISTDKACSMCSGTQLLKLFRQDSLFTSTREHSMMKFLRRASVSDADGKKTSVATASIFWSVTFLDASAAL